MSSSSLSQEVAGIVVILSEYIKVHNAIFRFSLRKWIPLPGFFERIDYAAHTISLGALSGELKSILEKTPAPAGLAEYGEALLAAIDHLRSICAKTANRIATGEPYPWTIHHQDVSLYHSLAGRCQSLGRKLSRELRTAAGSDT